MRKIVHSLCLLLILLGLSTSSQATLFGITFDGNLISIDTTTGAGTLVGATGFGNFDALEYDDVNGVLYGIANFKELVRIDPATAATTLIGTVSGFGGIEALAFRDGILYGAAGGPFAKRLVTIDPVSAAATEIGPFNLSGSDVDGLAAPTVGNLLGTNITAFLGLTSIDPATGSASLVSNLVEVIIGLDFSPGGTLFAASVPNAFSGGPSKLLTIDPVSGTTTTIGDIGFNTVVGLAFVEAAIPLTPSVPEPGTILLLGAGVLGLYGRRRTHSA